MRKAVTAILSILLLLVLVGPAAAQQDVTVKDINFIPQSGIDALNAAGANLQSGDIDNTCTGLIYVGTLCTSPRTSVRFTAVVLSDPLNSGLASVNGGVVGRIHIFVRDINADTEGNEGMGIQVVDGSNSLGLEEVVVGDVVTVVGNVNPFRSTMQVEPTSIQVVGFRDPSGGDPIFDPILVTTSDLNKTVDGGTQVNWDNLSRFRGNYVRLEGVTVQRRDISSDRVDWNWSSDNGITTVSMYDTSIRYRNDKSDYPSNFNGRGSRDDYVPPAAGSSINIQGFVTYNGGTSSDPFALGVPNGELLALNPMNDSDVEIVEFPINVSSVDPSSTVPGATTIEILADIQVDPSRLISSARMMYTTSAEPLAKSKNPKAPPVGSIYTFELPAIPDGEFGTFWFEASDNGGGQYIQPESERLSFRSLHSGITSIDHIQRTPDDKEGTSVFNRWTADMDLVVTVQTNPVDDMNFVQDGTDPWSGIFLRSNPLAGLQKGDQIRITRARVDESFGLTRLRDVEFEMVSQGGTPFDYVNLTTNMIKDPDIAESFEGMLVSVDDVTITATNADDPFGPYGEFAVSSDGSSANAIRVDDQADLVEYGDPTNSTDDDPSVRFSQYEILDFVRGPLYYGFGNSKILPESFADIGDVLNVAIEENGIPETFALGQNYPNPFNPSTAINYDVPVTGQVTLHVYDSLGRLVRTLVNGEHTPGAYRVTFDATTLASGLYMYRLAAGSHTAVRTMILLK